MKEPVLVGETKFPKWRLEALAHASLGVHVRERRGVRSCVCECTRANEFTCYAKTEAAYGCQGPERVFLIAPKARAKPSDEWSAGALSVIKRFAFETKTIETEAL